MRPGEFIYLVPPGAAHDHSFCGVWRELSHPGVSHGVHLVGRTLRRRVRVGASSPRTREERARVVTFDETDGLHELVFAPSRAGAVERRAWAKLAADSATDVAADAVIDAATGVPPPPPPVAPPAVVGAGEAAASPSKQTAGAGVGAGAAWQVLDHGGSFGGGRNDASSGVRYEPEATHFVGDMQDTDADAHANADWYARHQAWYDRRRPPIPTNFDKAPPLGASTDGGASCGVGTSAGAGACVDGQGEAKVEQRWCSGLPPIGMVLSVKAPPNLGQKGRSGAWKVKYARVWYPEDTLLGRGHHHGATDVYLALRRTKRGAGNVAGGAGGAGGADGADGADGEAMKVEAEAGGEHYEVMTDEFKIRKPEALRRAAVNFGVLGEGDKAANGGHDGYGVVPSKIEVCTLDCSWGYALGTDEYVELPGMPSPTPFPGTPVSAEGDGVPAPRRLNTVAAAYGMDQSEGANVAPSVEGDELGSVVQEAIVRQKDVLFGSEPVREVSRPRHGHNRV